MTEKKNIIKDFLSKGYAVVDSLDHKELLILRNRILKLTFQILKINTSISDDFFDNFHKYVTPNNIKKLKLKLIKKINKDNFFKKTYF